MKPILLFLVLSIFPAYYFGSNEISRHFVNSEIEKSPEFAPATFESIIKSGFGKFISFQVRYKFLANGKEYYSVTTKTDERGALGYVSDANASIAYKSNDPSINTLKKHYDVRESTGTLKQSIIIVALISTVIVLPITILISLGLGWFKRKRPQFNTPPTSA